MRFHAIPLCIAAGLAVAACSEVRPSSNAPLAGTAAGPGAPAIQQQSREAPGSANASAGTATFSGTQGTRPNFEYSGAAGNVGSTTPPTLPTTGRSRSN